MQQYVNWQIRIFSPRKIRLCSQIHEMYTNRTLARNPAWHMEPVTSGKEFQSWSVSWSRVVHWETGRLLPGESWYSQYRNTPHCDCWETSDKSGQDFPAPASHSASIAHSSVTMKNIHVKGLNQKDLPQNSSFLQHR